MSGKIAPALLPAYTMLFSHILRTYDGICTRPSASMQSDLQMALLTQTWRVVDVLAPASSRDVRICTEIGCCAGELEMHCSTSPDDLDHESPSNVMFDSESSMNSEEVLCDSESATIKLRTFDFPMGKRARANMICLIQGGEVENVGIAHVEVTMGINEFIAEFAAMERLEMENEDTETESTRENDESVRESFAELLTYL